MRQNALGIPKIAAEGSHRREAMQERPAVLNRDGIIIDIYDARIRVALLCQLMHIPLRRQARPDIYELAYTLFRDKEWNDPLEELAVLQRHKRHVRRCAEYPSCGFPVRRIVVLAAQVVVEYPRGIRCDEVNWFRCHMIRHGHIHLLVNCCTRPAAAVAHRFLAFFPLRTFAFPSEPGTRCG